MKCERLLRICIWLVSVYAVVVSDRHAYEAYGVAEFSRDSSTDCMREVCVVEGNVGTMHAQSPHQDSSVAQAAVYGVQDGNGTMQLLGISNVTRAHVSDRVYVNFNWQDSRLVILVYVRRNTSDRDAMLLSRTGKNTHKFLLGAPNQCHLCKNSASVITGMEVRNTGLIIKSALSDAIVTSTCLGGSPAPCPGPTSSTSPSLMSSAPPSPSPTSIADSSASRRLVHTSTLTPSEAISDIPSSPSGKTAIPSVTTSASIGTAASSPATTAVTTFTTASVEPSTFPGIADSFSVTIAGGVSGPLVGLVILAAVIVVIFVIIRKKGQCQQSKGQGNGTQDEIYPNPQCQEDIACA